MQSKFALSLLMVSALALSACAKAPSKIAPIAVSEESYAEQTCESLVMETTRIDTELAMLFKKQQKARGMDVAALIIVGIPVTWLYKGSKEPEIAQLKGEMIAIEQTALGHACELPSHADVHLPVEDEIEETSAEQLGEADTISITE